MTTDKSFWLTFMRGRQFGALKPIALRWILSATRAAEGHEISARWLSRNGHEFQVSWRKGVAPYISDVESTRRFSGALVHDLQALLSTRKEIIFSPLAQGDDYREQLAALLG